jgi:hypothetical protein
MADKPTLRTELKMKALCGSGDHSTAVAALLGAAAEILTMRFEPAAAAALIQAGIADTLCLLQPVGSA